MENIIDRLVKYMDFKKLNPNKITIEAKLSVGLIGKSIQAKKGLHSETIEKFLLTYNDVNPEWFVLGKGQMIRNSNYPDLNIVAEPIAEYKIDIDKDKYLSLLQQQIADLKEDKEELKKDKRILQDIIDNKLGNQNAS